MIGAIAMAAGGFLGTGLIALTTRDIYACLPSFQMWLIRLAARRLPEGLRNQHIEQWSADIADLPPSQLLRTVMAADCIRGAILMSDQIRRASRNTAWLRFRAKFFFGIANLSYYLRIRATELQFLMLRVQLYAYRLTRKAKQIRRN